MARDQKYSRNVTQIDIVKILNHMLQRDHALSKNGLLLRSYFFDSGYINVDEDYRTGVSRRLHEDYGNGRVYYKHHGQKLLILPKMKIDLPSKEYLRWHNGNVFLA